MNFPGAGRHSTCERSLRSSTSRAVRLRRSADRRVDLKWFLTIRLPTVWDEAKPTYRGTVSVVGGKSAGQGMCSEPHHAYTPVVSASEATKSGECGGAVRRCEQEISIDSSREPARRRPMPSVIANAVREAFAGMWRCYRSGVCTHGRPAWCMVFQAGPSACVPEPYSSRRRSSPSSTVAHRQSRCRVRVHSKAHRRVAPTMATPVRFQGLEGRVLPPSLLRCRGIACGPSPGRRASGLRHPIHRFQRMSGALRTVWRGVKASGAQSTGDCGIDELSSWYLSIVRYVAPRQETRSPP